MDYNIVLEDNIRRLKLIKCEMHLHTFGGSPCGKVSPRDIAILYNRAGYGAITVTNHYMKYFFEHMYPFGSDTDRIKNYIGFYKGVEYYCKPFGIKVFLGMELNPECMNTPTASPAAEFLCYGVTEDFLYNNLRLYDYTQRELFELFNRNDIVMLQSHPFREYCTLGELEYMHGIEEYNGHKGHTSHNEKAKELVKQQGFIGISGSDFHEMDGITAGVYIPETIDNNIQFAEYIKNNKLKLIKE